MFVLQIKFFDPVVYHAQVHLHPSRQSHKPTSLHFPEGFPHSRNTGSVAYIPPREKLELFAVLCIETSHYVSFVKHGPKTTDWIFFDSMADRVGECKKMINDHGMSDYFSFALVLAFYFYMFLNVYFCVHTILLISTTCS